MCRFCKAILVRDLIFQFFLLLTLEQVSGGNFRPNNLFVAYEKSILNSEHFPCRNLYKPLLHHLLKTLFKNIQE